MNLNKSTETLKSIKSVLQDNIYLGITESKTLLSDVDITLTSMD